MPTSKIISIEPHGQKFFSQAAKCDLYPFFVEFEDGASGEANSKSQVPPYRVGDDMDYVVTGQSPQGANKLKISKPGSNFAPPARDPGSSSGQSRILPPKTVQSGPVNGASVGMAINQALALLTKDMIHGHIQELICQPHFWQSVVEVASDVIRVSRHLEQGNLAPSVKERANGVSSPKTAVSQPSRGNVAPARQAPTERQMANQGEDLDEDVPF